MREEDISLPIAIFIVIFAVGVVLGVGSLINNNSPAEPDTGDWVDDEYCLVWAGFLDRATLMTRCVDFKNEQLRCNWQVQDDLSIYVWSDDINNGTIYPCTKKVDVKRLVQEEQ